MTQILFLFNPACWIMNLRHEIVLRLISKPKPKPKLYTTKFVHN